MTELCGFLGFCYWCHLVPMYSDYVRTLSAVRKQAEPLAKKEASTVIESKGFILRNDASGNAERAATPTYGTKRDGSRKLLCCPRTKS